MTVSTESPGRSTTLTNLYNVSHFILFRHPQSIDALCRLPSSYPSSNSTILTGSSDGLLRAVQLFPTKLLGVVADHGSFPVERIAVDQDGEGRWLGSAGHDNTLKMTDLKDVFEDEDDGDQLDQLAAVDEQNHDTIASAGDTCTHGGLEAGPREELQGSDSDAPREKKRKRKGEKDSLMGKKRKGRNEVDAEPSFFSGL